MKGKMKYLCVVAVFGVVALTGTPAMASQFDQFDVVFYELTEEATFISDSSGNITQRIGAGSLAGEARVGRSPLCPRAFVEILVAVGLATAGHPCYVTAIGEDTINVLTGTGRFNADIQVKVQGDNPVDAPELVVMTARIEGSLMIADPELRLLAITGGTLQILQVLDFETFMLMDVDVLAVATTGMVRLPFVVDRDGRSRKARRYEQAFYLNDHGLRVPVKQDELSLRLATARFELNFEGIFP